MGFLRSSARFIWRVAHRAVAAIVLWVLDASQFYSDYVVEWIGPTWAKRLDPYVSRASEAVPYLIALIIIGAILYTFYEVDREVTRNPKIGKTLKRFYGQTGEMLARKIANDEELVQLQADARQCVSEARNWIKANMEEASLRRFEITRHQLPYHHDSPFNTEHQKWLNGISVSHENIQALIDSDAWR